MDNELTQYERDLLAVQYKLFTETLPSGKKVDRVVRPDDTWALRKDKQQQRPKSPVATVVSPKVEAKPTEEKTAPTAPTVKPVPAISTTPVPIVKQSPIDRIRGHVKFPDFIRAMKSMNIKIGGVAADQYARDIEDVYRYGLPQGVIAATQRRWTPLNSPKAQQRKVEEVAAAPPVMQQQPTPVVDETPDLHPLTNFAGRPPKKIEASKLLANTVHPLLQGTKFAADMIYARDKFGRHDNILKKLASKALNRTATAEDHKEIGRRLYHMHADPSKVKAPAFAEKEGNKPEVQTGYRQHALQIASDYNWKHVADKLDLDDIVHDYVTRVFSNTRNKHTHADGKVNNFTDYAENDSHLRAAHNFFGKGAENGRHAKYGVSKEAHTAFWNKLQDFVKNKASGVGASIPLGKISEHDLQQSLLRLAKGEQNRHNIAKDKVTEGVSDPTYSAPPHERMAWEKSGNGQWNRRPDAHAWQFKRDYEDDYCDVIRYGLFENIKNLVTGKKEVNESPDDRRISVDSRGNEPGINMFTGNKRKGRDEVLDAKVLNRKKHFDGVVHNATLPGVKGIDYTTYKPAAIEQAAVGHALDEIKGNKGLPASHKEIQDHIAALRDLRSNEKGRAKLGPGIDEYEKHANELKSKYPYKGEVALLRSAVKGQRPTNKDVLHLSSLLKPLLFTANEHLVNKRRIEAANAGNDYYFSDLLPNNPNNPDLEFQNFGYGKDKAAVNAGSDIPEEFPDFDLNHVKDYGTNKDIEDVENTLSPEEMVTAAHKKFESPVESVPLAKKKKGGQFKSKLKNYGVEVPKEEPVVETEKPLPLVKGKVKKLPPIRQRRLRAEGVITDPELLQYARDLAAIKYGAAEDEAGFHQSMIENPEDKTNALVYADWLQDQGKEAQANHIRQHSPPESHEQWDDMEKESKPTIVDNTGYLNKKFDLKPGEAVASVMYYPSNNYHITLAHPTANGKTLKWRRRGLTKDEVATHIRDLNKEGVKIVGGIGPNLLESELNKETPDKHARAGEGGLIVDYGLGIGKYKPGGQMVEKLGTGDTTGPSGSKKKKRKGSIRLKLKKWIANKGFTSFN